MPKIVTRTVPIELLQAREADGVFVIAATVSSDAPITRYGFVETLDHSAEAINLSRVPLPVIECHDLGKVNIAIAENPSCDGHRLRMDVRFGESERARELRTDIESGVVRYLSIAYSIELEEFDAHGNSRITRWTPFEVSIVSAPADINAQFQRSASMPEQAVQTEEQRQFMERGATIERQRQNDIRSRVKVARLSTEFAQRMIDDGVSGDAIATRILDTLIQQQESTNTRAHSDASTRDVDRHPLAIDGRSRSSDLADAAIDALLIRAQIPVTAPHAAARDLQRSRISDIARYCLNARGYQPSSGLLGFAGDSPADLIKRAMSSSDLPYILENALGKALRTGYQIEPGSHRAWVRPSQVPDFKLQSRTILGSLPDLQKVNEGGEYKYGALTDDKASYKVEKYGRIVGVTLEMLVNDDLDAILRQLSGFGQKALQLEADVVYDLIKTNSGAGQAMQDGNNLFDNTNHANLETSAAQAFSADRMNLGRVKLRRQTALGGGLLNLEPRYLIIPPEYETAAEQIISERTLLATATTGAVSTQQAATWYSKLRLVVEARLATGAIYLAAENTQIDTCEVATLDDQLGGPALQQREGWEKDGTEFKVRHTFGARFLDWRGIVKVPVS